MNGLPSFFGVPWLFGLFLVAQCIVILLLAVAVKEDAERLERNSQLFLVRPWMWFFVVVFSGGYLPSLAYWLIHYSSLKSRREEKG